MYAYRAMILSDLGRRADAFASVAQAVKLEPGNPRYTQMLEQINAGTFAAVQTE